MEIMSRSQAISEGKNTYFTGKPCKNGHLTYRYVYSGSCFGCIKNDRPAKSLDANYAFKKASRMAKVFIHLDDVEEFERYVHAVAALRFPGVGPDATRLDLRELKGSRAFFRFRAAPADHVFLANTARNIVDLRYVKDAGKPPDPRDSAPVTRRQTAKQLAGKQQWEANRRAEEANEYLPGSGPLNPFN